MPKTVLFSGKAAKIVDLNMQSRGPGILGAVVLTLRAFGSQGVG